MSQLKDPAMLTRLLSGALLLNPDVTTFWNMRRELMQTGRLDVQGELHFTAVLLSRKPKCAEAFAHRKWVVGRLLLAGVDVDELLEEELQVTQHAADRYPNNYHAWSHRMWCITHLAPSSTAPLLKEWATSESWIQSHVSDHSGLQYRQFLLNSLLELKHPAVEEVADKTKKSLEQFLFSCEAIPLPSTKKDDILDIAQYFKVSAVMKFVPLLTSELMLNMDLIQRFTGHEALWCHRRFLLTLFKKCLSCRGFDVNGTGVSRFNKVAPKNKFGDEKCAEVSLTFPLNYFMDDKEKGSENDASQIGKCNNHKNMHGVPLEKDQKFSSDDLVGLDKKEREFYSYLHKVVMWHEAKLINSGRPDELHQQRLAKQHQKWLLHVLKVDMPAVACH
ncbi:hypothetical protein C0J52_20401 [Blattella germanica]|nr:hypothetical protein C0J52_20401 [Blattella germanica]